jgi:hypothetical protein
MAVIGPNDGDSKRLWNVAQFLQNYTAQYPIGHSSSNLEDVYWTELAR